MANGHGGARPGAGRKKGSSPANDNRGQPEKPASPPQRLASFEALAALVEASRERAKTRERTRDWCPFKIAEHPPMAMPRKELTMAMDDALMGNNNWAADSWMAGGMLSSVASEGLLFLGYPFLSELAQRAEYRIISETIATELTRKWVRFKGKGDADKTDKISELNDFLDDLKLRDRFCDIALQDGEFGRSHLFLDPGDVSDDELKTPIGTGRDRTTKGKLGTAKGWLKSLRVIEPLWVYPTTYNAQNPLRGDWYNPQVWYVMGREIHRSRIPTFIGRPVPDLLKPAYSFGGLSLSQMAKPYVDIWLQTRESVAEIVRSFSVMVLETDLATRLMPGGGGAADVLARVAAFNALRDNQGTFVINKNTEGFQNVSAPLSGLHELQAQSQEHVASVARIPLVKYTGIEPSGLNASSEGSIRTFYDSIAAFQPKLFDPNLDFVIDVAMITLWGERDPDIVKEYVPLHSLTEKEEAELRKTNAETAQIHIDSGVLWQEEERARVASDPQGLYPGLDPEDVPDLKEEEEAGLVPPGAGKGLEAVLEEPGERGGEDAAILPFAEDAEWREGDHPRDASGKFGAGGGHAAATAYKEHAAVNEWLRGERDPSTGSAKENKKIIAEMDELIASSKTDKAQTLYRGFGDADVVKNASGKGYVRDPAFLSTSTDEGIAREFAGSGYVAAIKVPAGTNAYSFGDDDPQKEVVLPRRTRLKISGADHQKKILHLTLVEAPAAADDETEE